MSGDARVQRAMQLLQGGDKAQARDILQKILVADRDHCQAWALMAHAADSRQESIFCLKQVLRLRPDDAWAAKKLRAFEAPAAAPPSQRRPPAPQPEKSAPAAAPPASLPSAAPPPEACPPAPQPQADMLLEGPQWMIDAVQAGRTLTKPSLSAVPKKQEGLDKSSMRMLIVGLWALVFLVVAGIFYAVYQDQFATRPEDEDKVLQAAREWAVAEATFDSAKMTSMRCSRYSSTEADLLSSLLLRQMGIDPNAVGSRLKIDPPKGLKYEIISLGGSNARVKVVGFLDDLQARLGRPLRFSESTYKSLNERIYIMKRESGEWKWCGQED